MKVILILLMIISADIYAIDCSKADDFREEISSLSSIDDIDNKLNLVGGFMEKCGDYRLTGVVAEKYGQLNDIEKMIYWYDFGARNGDIPSMMNWSIIVANNKESSPDEINLAIGYLKILSVGYNFSSFASYKLGSLYLKVENYCEAINSFNLSLVQGYESAKIKLLELTEKYEGCKSN